MKLTGENILGFSFSKKGDKHFQGFNPTSLEELPERFTEATPKEVDQAVQLAKKAFHTYKNIKASQRAAFLEAIAYEIISLDEKLISRAVLETGLPEARIIGERGRTVDQLRMFAELIREGSWVEATIDTAIPDRQPVPKPDLRRMLVPLGPIGVFSASNFPLAFSVAGGDTASALAAGTPVIVKAHPNHPGTSEWVGRAIEEAARKTRMPDGVFSLIQGNSYEVGKELVLHPDVKAIGFTGSLAGGRALFDMANSRKSPIPVFAEMGSINPVFVLPEATAKRGETIAKQLAASVTLGVGQFCTKPGLIIVQEGTKLSSWIQVLSSELANAQPGKMLGERISEGYYRNLSQTLSQKGVTLLQGNADAQKGKEIIGIPSLAKTTAKNFLKNPALHNEVFGPFSLLVVCRDMKEMEEVAAALEGQLTVTLMAEEKEMNEHKKLQELLVEKTGRCIFNGVPTGVEVCNAMQHGGPYPATSDSRFTSVGTGAIKRFVRPVSFQNWPESQLPEELQSENPLNLLRWVNNEWTRRKICL